MLEFRALEIEDKALLNDAMQRDGVISSIRTFSNLYIWGEHFRICSCIKDGIVFFKACYREDFFVYYLPLGDDMAHALKLIEEDAKSQGKDYELWMLPESGKQSIELACPGKFDFIESPDQDEYIYNAEDLINLRGKKYHGKRNFINRFCTEYSGRWEYSPVDPVKDYDDIIAYVRRWCDSQDADPEDYRYEYSAIIRALKYYSQLDIRGGIIRLDGKIIAFTLATPQNDEVMDVLIEKAEWDIDGAYQMINNQFAKRECVGYKYLNREEDMGIEGLRQAKMSYHPAFLSTKFKAVPRK